MPSQETVGDIALVLAGMMLKYSPDDMTNKDIRRVSMILATIMLQPHTLEQYWSAKHAELVQKGQIQSPARAADAAIRARQVALDATIAGNDSAADRANAVADAVAGSATSGGN